jgi:hypothetical protein
MKDSESRRKKTNESYRPTLEDLAAMNAAASLAELSQVDAALAALAGSGFWEWDDWSQGPLTLE